MKQTKLLKELNIACIKNDIGRIQKLKKIQIEKILKHRAKGKPFSTKWTLVNL